MGRKIFKMLITFKTLEQKTFKIEIEETEKIKILKEKIAEEKGADQFPPTGQKLIYSRKILDDDKTISECNIDVKNFVVVMVVKQKAKPADKPKESESSSSSSTATAAATPAPAATPAEPMSVDTSTASTTSTESTTGGSATASSETATTGSTTSANTTESAASALLTGTALESSITELMALGYSREQVMLALNRSFHNADRAAEYLLSGNIPEAPGDNEGGGDDVLGQVSDAAAPASVGEGAGGGTTDLSFLRNLPQFQLMRTQVQSSPESLPLLLQGIGETNPELLSLINQNQQQFISILNERPETDTDAPASDQAYAPAGGGAAGQPFQIQVTEGEKQAIDRLVGMGFPEADVIQAFFACDKNEQLAVEFLCNDTF